MSSKKELVLKFLEDNSFERYTIEDIGRELNLSKDSIGGVLYGIFSKNEDNRYKIKRKKINGTRLEYWCTKNRSSGVAEDELSIPELSPLNATVMPSYAPSSHLTSDLVGRIAAMEHRLQSYEQAFQAIASIVEQMGHLEEVK
jgi:hypothetical protein